MPFVVKVVCPRPLFQNEVCERDVQAALFCLTFTVLARWSFQSENQGRELEGTGGGDQGGLWGWAGCFPSKGGGGPYLQPHPLIIKLIGAKIVCYWQMAVNSVDKSSSICRAFITVKNVFMSERLPCFAPCFHLLTQRLQIHFALHTIFTRTWPEYLEYKGYSFYFSSAGKAKIIIIWFDMCFEEKRRPMYLAGHEGIQTAPSHKTISSYRMRNMAIKALEMKECSSVSCKVCRFLPRRLWEDFLFSDSVGDRMSRLEELGKPEIYIVGHATGQKSNQNKGIMSFRGSYKGNPKQLEKLNHF